MRTLFLTLEEGLRQAGHRVTGVAWNGADPSWRTLAADTPYRALAEDSSDLRDAARRFVAFCEAEQVDIVLPNNSRIITSAIPHLPRGTAVVMRTNSTSRPAYSFVLRHQERVDAWIATSRRQHRFLLRRNADAQERVHLVPNGVAVPAEPARFLRTSDTGSFGPLRIVFVGRLHHSSKGVLLFPAILDRLAKRGVSYRLDIIGQGPDEAALRQGLARHAPCIRWHGTLERSDVMRALTEAEVLLMPSRYEGFGWSAVEAMSLGVVPVASRLRDVLDWIIVDGFSGRLVPVDVVDGFAAALADLAEDRQTLRRLGRAARAEVACRFSRERMISGYLSVFHQAAGRPEGERPPPLPLDAWKPFAEFRPGLLHRAVIRATPHLPPSLRVWGEYASERLLHTLDDRPSE